MLSEDGQEHYFGDMMRAMDDALEYPSVLYQIYDAVQEIPLYS